MKKIVLCGILISIFLIAGCQAPQGGKAAGMANPASVHCVDNGGELKIKKDADGNEYGLCLLQDGTSCEEWTYFRGECPKEGSGISEKSTLKGPASNKLEFIPIADDKVVSALKNKEIDIYMGAITPEQAEELKADSSIELMPSPSQYFSLGINKAPSTDTILNPFSNKETRMALNNLIDRLGMIDTVFNGYAQVKPTYLFEASPDYDIVKDIVEKYDFSYKPDDAKAVIDEQMTKAGAVKKGGIWEFNDKPVVIKYVIYTGGDYGEIEEVSNYVADAIESAGFTIEKILYDRETKEEDNPMRNDPAELGWNLRTGTGIYYGFSKFDTYGIVGRAPFRLKGSPGSRTENFWVYENSKLDEIGKKLYSGNYSDETEWKSLFREGMDIILDESYGISFVAKQNMFAVRTEVKNLYESEFLGIRLLRNFREGNIPGKDKLVLGTKETYNPEDGFSPNWFAGNIYRMDIKMAVRDFGTWSNPKTLEYGPLRWDYEIKTAGPFDKLDVPSDAVLWDSEKKSWKSVGDDVKATTMISFDMSEYIGTNWHNGAKISWADVLYQLAQGYESVYNEGWNEISESQSKYLDPYKGFRINGNNFEMYIDFWHFNEGEIADFAVFSPDPWVLYAATNSIVYEDKTMMYYSSKAAEFDVPVMRLIDSDQVKIVLDKINTMEYSDLAPYFTIGDTVYATEDEFKLRKQILEFWAERYGHLIIGEGPFYFGSFSEADGKVTLKAFRDETYPFKKGDWIG